MRKVHLPSIIVKKTFNSRLSVLFAALLVGAVSLLSVFGFAIYPNNKAQKYALSKSPVPRQSCCGEVGARRMPGTYYNTRGDWKSELIVNNKGPNPIVITPILYSLAGEKYVAPVVKVAGQAAHEIYLDDLAQTAGPAFAEGSYEFTYTGRPLEMGGGLYIADNAKGLMFDEQLTEPGVRFSSDRAEVVYPVPRGAAEITLLLTSTSDQPFMVKGGIFFDSQNDSPQISATLRAHETKLIKLWDGATNNTSAGAVSLNHTGGIGALLAMIHVAQPRNGFSVAVPFTDPMKAKTSKINGAGLRLGRLNGKVLTPVIAVRNVGGEQVSVNASIPVSVGAKVGRVKLPKLSLAPKQLKLIDTSNIQWQQFDSNALASLDVEYSGAPGSVVLSALSATSGGDEVFPLLMRDPESILSSTGGYAWFAEDKYATTVYISNVSGKEQQFRADIAYQGGMWGSNLKKLAPGETYALDIKRIRDAQVKGSVGNTIPLNAESGHVYWTIFGSHEKALIGRAETVDPANSMASTYECQTCHCSQGYYDSRISPENDHHEPGGTRNFIVQQQDYNCFGGPGSWFAVTAPITWSTYDGNIATVNSVGTVTAQNQQGATGVLAEWTAYTGSWNASSEICEQTPLPRQVVGDFTTDPPIPTHVRVLEDQQGYDVACPTTGVRIRQIQNEIHNQYHRLVSALTVESFPPVTHTPAPDGCGTGSPTPSGCGGGGTSWIDTMTVSGNFCGSGVSQSSGCGYDITSTWATCSGVARNIWRYTAQVRSNLITVNGNNTKFPFGHEFPTP